MNLEYDPKFIMQDASQASYNAAKKLFPNADILMCYYHVTFNIIKYAGQIKFSNAKLEEIKEDITKMHWARNEAEYNARVAEFKQKYQKNYKAMHDYINNQWLTGPFNKWQVFRNPPGFANTNSNIESFNASIKRDFTIRRRMSISVNGGLSKLKEIVVYYSNIGEPFEKQPPFCEKALELAKGISKKQFKMQGRQLVIYNGSNTSFKIKLDNSSFSCDCKYFIKGAVCKHTVAYSMLYELNWFGLKYSKEPTKFACKAKRGRIPNAKKALIRQ